MAASKKARAGLLLSGFLRDIAEEKTELVTVDGEDRMVSKAQALARLIWQRGLGWVEQMKTEDGLVDVIHQPDRVYVQLLLDRLEGRVAAVEPGKKEQRTVSDRVGEQSKKRINSMSKDSDK